MNKLPLYWRLHPLYRLGMAVLLGQLLIAFGFVVGAIQPKPSFVLAYKVHAVVVPTLLVAGPHHRPHRGPGLSWMAPPSGSRSPSRWPPWARSSCAAWGSEIRLQNSSLRRSA